MRALQMRSLSRASFSTRSAKNVVVVDGCR